MSLTATGSAGSARISVADRWRRLSAYGLTPEISDLCLAAVLAYLSLPLAAAAVAVGLLAVLAVAALAGVTAFGASRTRSRHIESLLAGDAHIQQTFTRWARVFAGQLGVTGDRANINVIVHGDGYSATCFYTGRNRPATIVVGRQVEMSGMFGLAVIAHEAAHAAGNDAPRRELGRIGGYIAAVSLIVFAAAVHPAAGLAVAVFARPAVSVLSARRQRSCEFHADRVAADLVGSQLVHVVMHALEVDSGRDGSLAERLGVSHPSPRQRQEALEREGVRPGVFPQLFDAMRSHTVDELRDFDVVDSIGMNPDVGATVVAAAA